MTQGFTFRYSVNNVFNPTEIWLDWLKDEIRLTEEEPNREKVYELFEKAVKDYICELITTLFLPLFQDCLIQWS